MARNLVVAAAQMAGVQPGDSRSATIERLTALLKESAARGARLVVFTEGALTPFFPHWLIEDEGELNSYFEAQMPGEDLKGFFELASELRVGFSLGYAELTPDGRRFNTCILVDETGTILSKYRKIHLPGYSQPRPDEPLQNLEKRYFEVGDLGWPTTEAFGGRVGMCICNDRRWPEAYRVMGLQGVELIVLGYNTPSHYPAMSQVDHLARLHNHLSMQANAYFNGTWVVGVAKAGVEAGIDQIGDSCIISPAGEIVAVAQTLGDEVITARIDFDDCNVFKKHMFNLRAHRRPEHYRSICASVEQTVPAPP